MCKYKKVKKSGSCDKHINFHETNYLLMMAYNQTQLKELNEIVNNSRQIFSNDLMISYEIGLSNVFRIAPRYTSNVNVLLRTFNYFSGNISLKERNFIFELIEEYKNHKVPFSVPLNVIKSYVIRFEIDELINQSFFAPYPKELMDVNDSGKGIY